MRDATGIRSQFPSNRGRETAGTLKHVPDAESYAPVTVLVDQRRDSVYLSHDLMASPLAPYGNPEACAVARELDNRIVGLMDCSGRVT